VAKNKKEYVMKDPNISGKRKAAASQNIKERDYWLNKLSGNPVKAFFPYDYPDNETNEKPGRRQQTETNETPVTSRLAGEIYTRLLKLSNRSLERSFTVLVTGLLVLLEKYTGHKDIIVPAPIFKQAVRGQFINTVLILRNKIEPGMTFKELLLQVRQTITEAVAHQNYPLEALQSELDMPYSRGGYPLFDAAVLLENIHDPGYLNHITSNMTFSFLDTGQHLETRLEYNPSRSKRTTMQRLNRYFEQLFRVVLFNLDVPVSHIDILPENEKKQLLMDFNNTDSGYSKDKTIHQLFAEQAKQTPDHTALVGPKGVFLTYNELNGRANQLARLLRARGIKQGSIACILLESSPELVIAIFAVLKAGGAYLPINPQYPEERVAAILNDSGASLILTFSRIRESYSFTRLQGLKISGVPIRMSAPRQQSDFDGLPLPDRTLIDFEKYSRYIGHAMVRKAVSIQGTRGCPYHCSFCHRTMQKKNVPRSAENIFQEVKFYYDMGVRRFSFVDEIFNFNTENSMRFFRLILKHRLKVQLFFPNGMRSDRLSKEYIDLMVEAGTVNLGLALETASPRLQKLIRKNINIPKLQENAEYFCSKYPNVILELFTMHGLPTETEEEANRTLNFVKNLKWIHFPYVFLLKIHPSTDMMKLALDSGISPEAIERSRTAAFHEIPETLPFPKSFTRQYVGQFLSEYFLSKERLLHVLPHQLRVASEDELARKYDNYLPADIKNFADLLENTGLTRGQLGNLEATPLDTDFVPDYRAMRSRKPPRSQLPPKEKNADAMRILLLDLSVQFSTQQQEILHGEVTEPLGLVYLMTYLQETFGPKITGKIAKAKIDFDSFAELKDLLLGFKPDLIGMRTLSYFRDFFHETVAFIKECGIEAAIIAGGPYGTSDYQLVLQDPGVDLTILKEGELTLAHLVREMISNNKKLPPEEVLEHMKGIAFIKNKHKRVLRKNSRQSILLDHLPGTAAGYSTENLENINTSRDILYLISTSGSTGAPKSVVLEHRNLVNLLEHQFASADASYNRILQFAPTGFDVSAQEIFSALLSGGTLFLLNSKQKHHIPALMSYIEKNGIETLFLPPAFLKFIFSQPGYPGLLSKSVRHIIAAGEQLVVPGELKKYLKDNRVVLHNHYGPTETHVVSNLTLDPTGEIPTLPTIGKPIANTRLYILDENRNLKPMGAPGELYIAGDNVGKGYLNNPELTAQKFQIQNKPEYYRSYRSYKSYILYKTGDRARWLIGDNGDRNIEFLGRIDQQVKIRGFRIELAEIESHLEAIDFIKEAAVIDRKNLKGETYLCAYMVTVNVPQSAETVADTRDFLAARLPGYMIPAYFVEINKIPLTPNGKVNRKVLPQPRIKADDNYIAPTNEKEKKLVEIWSDVLEIEESSIGMEADFFQLGGHSLKATILINKIHKTFDVKVTLAEMFEQPTISGLSRYIEDAKTDIYSDIQPEEKREYYPLSPSQKRLYILQWMEIENTHYNIPSVLELELDIEKEKLEETLTKLIKRHETLRTSFKMLDQQPVQRIHDEVSFSVNYSETGREKAQEKAQEFTRPFDLEQAPLLRVELIKVAEKRFFLMYDMHHIITDGTSMEVFKKEFSLLYGGELPALRIQYRDYSQWQNRLFESGEIKKQKEYWLNQLGKTGELAPLDIPTDYPRPLIQGFEGNKFRFVLSARETERLQATAEKNDVTPYMLLLALLNILFSKLGGQEDIILGTPIAARRHVDLQNVIGMLVNTLALRNYPRGDKPLTAFLKEVKQRTLDAFENQEYPFDELVDELSLQRDASRNPLFDVMFNYFSQDREQSPEESPENYLQDLHQHIKSVSRFDMAFSATYLGPYIVFGVEYSTKLFKPGTIERLIGYLKQLISSLPENFQRNISEIEIITAEEKAKILEICNGMESPVDDDSKQTLHCLFARQAAQTPDRTALVGAGKPFSNLQLTYRELNKRSNQLAHLLKEKGVGTDSVVGLMVERSAEMVIGLLGIIKAGGAYLPIDPSYPRERVLAMLADSDAAVLLTSGDLLHRFPVTALENIKGLDWQPVVTPACQQITDIDKLPYPDRTLVDYQTYHQSIGIALAKHTVAIQCTRGCPYNCAYCHKIWPKKHVARSAENIFTEIRQCYEAGARRFTFIDDIFNLDHRNSSRFLETIIKHNLDIQLFFPNGLRGDILTREFIDLMVEAGTVDICLALETASPRIQKLIKKNLDLDKFRENILYIAEKYPRVVLEMEMMIGFPTETEEEALLTFDFLKSIKWVHVPNLHILKIYPNTDMYRLALENGVDKKLIEQSTGSGYHQLSATLPFSGEFVKAFQARFLKEYFLSKERLLQVLPHQVKHFSKDEILQKYDSYLPMEIKSLDDLLRPFGISPEELGPVHFLPPHHMSAPNFSQRMERFFPRQEKAPDAFRVLLIDLSQLFRSESENTLYDVIEEPLGLMYLMSYLNKHFGARVDGKVLKSRIDFDNFQELKTIISQYKPDLIGLRTLSLYKEFFHTTVLKIRHWDIQAPIIAGGPYATSDYRLMLQDGNIDLAVLGEGELTLTLLVEKMIANNNKLPSQEQLKTLPGIAFAHHHPRRVNSNGFKQEKGRDIILLDEITGKLGKYPGENPVSPAQSHPHDLLYVIYTSGSTGKPKGTMLEHRNLVNLLRHQYRYTDIDHSRVLQFTIISFDVASQEIFSTLLAGGQLCLVGRETLSDIPGLFKLIEKKGIKTLFLPASFLKFVMNEEEYIKCIPPGLSHIVTAGEQAVIGDRLKKYLRKNGVYFHNHYGPSETHVVTALTLGPGEELPQLPSIGRPLINTRIDIVDKGYNLQPAGIAGELLIGGVQVGRGYLNNPELTAQKFDHDLWDYHDKKNNQKFLPGGPGGAVFSKSAPPGRRRHKTYSTGDLARWLVDSNIEFLGRMDSQVKIRGFRVEPGEIEFCLLAHRDIKEVVVLAREEKGGHYLCAYIVSDRELTVPEMREYLADKLPAYMLPSYFVRLEKIPLSPNRKILRGSLPEPGLEAEKGHIAPANPLEEKLLDIWSEVLGVEKSLIGMDRSFFEMGGHSLKATIMVSKIARQLDIRLPLTEIFTTPHIRGLANYIMNMGMDTLPAADTSLVLLGRNPGAPGHLFFIHDGSGEVDGYVEFCQHLGDRFNYWGIRAERTKDAPVNVTIEEIAAKYIKKIKKIQPRGPYFIVGWCIGGTVAFEMARQLEGKHEKIAYLALIDAPSPGDCTRETLPLFTLESERHFIKKYLPVKEIAEKLEGFTDIGQVWPFIANYLENETVDLEVIKRAIIESGQLIVPNYTHLSISQMVEYLNRGRTLYHARSFYRPPGKVRTPVHCFNALESVSKKEPWDFYCDPPITVYDVPGDHFSMFKMPHVAEFARIFSRTLPGI
jgi:amino acid adenylation domain-containing protein